MTWIVRNSRQPGVTFLNLRGDQQTEASFVRKVSRVLVYYARLIRYAATAKPKLFHILWNNKFESFDRTLLMLYYKCLGKRIVLTAHNVNAGKRDSNDSFFNRLTLRFQYRLADHVFVHTEKMKAELSKELGVEQEPDYGHPVRDQQLRSEHGTHTRAKPGAGWESATAKRRSCSSVNIAPYKGLEYLISAFRRISAGRDDYRLIIAGRPKNCDGYWQPIRQDLAQDIQKRPGFTPRGSYPG